MNVKSILLAVLAASVLLVGATGAVAANGNHDHDHGDEGPPVDLPDVVPDFVGDILNAVADFLGGSLSALGDVVSGIAGGR